MLVKSTLLGTSLPIDDPRSKRRVNKPVTMTTKQQCLGNYSFFSLYQLNADKKIMLNEK